MSRNWINTTARAVVELHAYACVDPATGEHMPLDAPGAQVLDVQSANALVTVYDAVSAEKQARLASLPVAAAVQLAWKCIERTRRPSA